MKGKFEIHFVLFALKICNKLENYTKWRKNNAEKYKHEQKKKRARERKTRKE